MAVIKVIVSTIISSLFIFGAVQAGEIDSPMDKYHGLWYTIEAILDTPITGEISCDWTNVTKHDGGEWDFYEVGRSIIDGVFHKAEGYGKVVDSKIHVYYPSHNWTDIFTITSYNNGNELIFHKEGAQNTHYLLSRHTTAPTETKAALEKLVTDQNHHIAHISQAGCDYNRD